MLTSIASGAPRARHVTPGDGGDHGGRGLRPAGAWTVAEARAAGFDGIAALAAWARTPVRIGRG